MVHSDVFEYTDVPIIYNCIIMDTLKIQTLVALTFAVVAVLIIGIIIYIFQYRKGKLSNIKEQKAIKLQHQQEILTTQLEIQSQTMQHIGREIHDSVGQKLTLASLYNQQLSYENQAPLVKDKIEIIGNIINESLSELRQLSKSLTDDTINHNNISELLQQECDKVNGLKKCEVSFTNDKKNWPLSYQAKSILLRVVQEFLQNSIKHADCKKITVALNGDDSILQLFLADDGKGFEIQNENKGIGLSNMKKRTELIGGNFHLQNAIGNGTQLFITIPLQQQ